MDRLSEISPAILSRAWIMGYSAQLADKFGRYDLRLWDQRFPKLMDMTKSGSAIRANVPEEANFDDYPDENTRVILIEDLNNLALAITSDPNFNRSDAMMLHVVSHNYPMRGFFVDKLTLATSFDAFFAQNLPLATDPSGSIIELAQTLATEFNNRNEISQNDLAHYFVEIPPGVQTTFDVYPTLMGLQNLFGQIGEKTGDFQESRQQPHRKSFKLISPMAIPRVTVPVQTVEADAKKIGYLSCSDHGLAYGRGTKTSFNGRTYVISKIDDAKIVVEARAFQSGPRPSYFFANNYTIHVSGSDTAFEIPLTFGRTAAQLLQTRAFLRGKVVRRTVGMLEVGESGRRFGPHVPQWRHGEEVEHTQEHPHAAMILLCLSGKDKRLETLTGLRLSRAAFTLAATLQDLMFSLFAIVGHRIAVLTPQAQEAIATAQMTQEDQSAGEYQRFPAERYPRLVADAAASGRETGPMDAQAWTATLYSFIGESLKSSADFDDPGKNILSLVIVEDSDHDLGALRHVFADWPMVLQRWGDYVTWLDLNKDKPDFYYRFGGDQLSSLFDFAAAAQIIAVMRNPDMGQKRGKT